MFEPAEVVSGSRPINHLACCHMFYCHMRETFLFKCVIISFKKVSVFKYVCKLFVTKQNYILSVMFNQ